MNKYSRNIVIVGKNNYDIKDIRDTKDNWSNSDYTHRFPYIIEVNDLKEALNHQGFLLIINELDIEPISYIDFDIKYRNKFKNYNLVIINSDKIGKNNQNILDTKLIINKKFYLNNLILTNMYEYYINEKEHIKFTLKRKQNIDMLYNYLKDKTFITTKKISNDLKVSKRWVQRYMQDINLLYENIGYDENNKRWYITSTK